VTGHVICLPQRIPSIRSRDRNGGTDTSTPRQAWRDRVDRLWVYRMPTVLNNRSSCIICDRRGDIVGHHRIWRRSHLRVCVALPAQGERRELRGGQGKGGRGEGSKGTQAVRWLDHHHLWSGDATPLPAGVEGTAMEGSGLGSPLSRRRLVKQSTGAVLIGELIGRYLNDWIMTFPPPKQGCAGAERPTLAT